jgi:hypothetical protein
LTSPHLQVRLPDGTFSKDFPSNSGLITDNDKEQTAFLAGLEAPLASTKIQAMFDTSIRALAIARGYKDVDTFIRTECDGIIYHFTINFMGAHTVHHVDEYKADGPARYIANMALWGSGVVFWKQTAPRPDGSWADVPAAGVWQRPGDAVVFAKDARTFMQHGVVKLGTLTKLPERGGGEGPAGWKDNVRIVITIRYGQITADEQKDWEDQWALDYKVDSPAPTTGATLSTPTRKSSRKVQPRLL